jgi:hypothetical protein
LRKCKRVRKGMKRKNLSIVASDAVASDEFRIGKNTPTPRCFRKNGKCRTYGIRNLEECTENGSGNTRQERFSQLYV